MRLPAVPLLDQVMDASVRRVRLLLGEGLPLGDLTRVLAAAFASRPALQAAEQVPGLPAREVRTYAELEDDVAHLAAAHADAGLLGQRVGVICSNRVDVLLHVLSLSRAGAVALPLNHRLRPEEMAAALEAAGASALVADAPWVEPLFASGHGAGLGCTWTGAGGAATRPGRDLPAWLRAHADARLQRGPAPDLASPALLLATSGTTGRPKVARLSSRSLLGALGRVHALPIGHQRGPRAGRDVLLAALPLVHVMGLSTMLAALCAGIRAVHLEHFEAAHVLSSIEAVQPNVFVGVPTMYSDLEAAGASERDLSSVQLWISAADAMPPERARRFQRYGALERVLGRRLGSAAFADIYGMVELGGAAALRLYLPSPRVLDLPALAVLLPKFEARVVDEAGAPQGWGWPGELQLRGPSVFSGYEGGAGPREGGWFPTGDLARLWPGGFFQFVGRAGERLKVGGFSVFPAEVEEALRAHPAVSDVVLVGLPDPRLGEVPAALVVPRAQRFDADEFLAWAKDRVAGYRRPHRAFAVHELPRGRNGKLDRRTAREMALALAHQ
jgi:acyl-CoA synthetase (AMP-forming)/AMP-acid ligase II